MDIYQMENSESKPDNSGLLRRKQLQQHHRRVPRACDECRLRKTKCDGLQPCSPCQTSDRCKSRWTKDAVVLLT